MPTKMSSVCSTVRVRSRIVAVVGVGGIGGGVRRGAGASVGAGRSASWRPRRWRVRRADESRGKPY